MKTYKHFTLVTLAFLLAYSISSSHAVPRPAGVFENTVDSLVFSGQRKVIRGKFPKRTQVSFTTKEGQEIIFPVTKFKRNSNGKARLNYLVPSIGILDENGDSITAGSKDLYVIVGTLAVYDDKFLANRQSFDMTIYIQPTQVVESVFLTTKVEGEADSIFKVERVGL